MTRGNARAELRSIFDAALAAVDPTLLVARSLARDGSRILFSTGRAPTFQFDQVPLVVGAGKAAAAMARGCEGCAGGGSWVGEIVIPDDTPTALAQINVSRASHPVPDARGEIAAHRIQKLLGSPLDASVLVLLSGGASSLLVAPRPPVTLADKQSTTRLLLEAGADIEALNTVRKHLSLVKGGGLRRWAGRRRMLTLALSDVPGDDPSVIGSGPTAADSTTYADAERILSDLNILDRVPASVREVLRLGCAGGQPETLKPAEAEKLDSTYVVIGSNRTALQAAATAAQRHGYVTDVDPLPLVGDTTVVAQEWGRRLLDRVRAHPRRRYCLLAGGETTVRVRGNGRGGRNQEFALALAPLLESSPVSVLSAGTDGIDGPTPAAGAFVDGQTARRAVDLGLDLSRALASNDSHTFFSTLQDLLVTGPTGTNVMDIKIAVYDPIEA